MSNYKLAKDCRTVIPKHTNNNNNNNKRVKKVKVA